MDTGCRRNAGFTLIEVLVTVLVLAGGLLGLIALQASILKLNQSAYYRTQATQLAYDMADRIRANPVQSTDIAKADPNKLVNSEYVKTTHQAYTSCFSSPGCTPAEMANNDVVQWLANIAATLPSGTGQITVDAPNRIMTVTVSWDDNKTGAADKSFAMSFQL